MVRHYETRIARLRHDMGVPAYPQRPPGDEAFPFQPWLRA
jgi:hypothetical protein